MKSVLFTIGSVSIYGYGLMIAIGIILCVWIAMFRAKRYGIDPDLIFNCALIGIIFGFIGAKLTYWLVEIKSVIQNPKIMLDIGSGFVAYGGLIAGILAPIIYVKKIKKQSFLDKLDLCVPSIAIGQGIGRIGCFLGGCCYGCELKGHHWYGVVFPEDAIAPSGVELFPSQIVSAIGLILIFLLLVLITPKSRFRGQITSLYMMIYAVCRFVIEFFRGDPRGAVGPFSTSQFIGFFIFAAGLILYFYFRKQAWSPLRLLSDREGEETEESAAEDAEEAKDEIAWAEPEVTEESAEESTEETAEEAEETLEVTEAAEDTAAEAAEEAAETIQTEEKPEG